MLSAVRKRIVQRINPQIRIAARKLLSEIEITRISRRSAGQFLALKNAKSLKVHLGCGPDIRSGWLNIDLALNGVEPPSSGNATFINYDLRRTLPLADESCDLIYSAHFLEHLEYKHGLQLLRECYRLLRPGGVIRISLPTFDRTFAAYL